MVNQVVFPKHTPFGYSNTNVILCHTRVTNQDVALFGYFNTNVILCHTTFFF